MIECIKCKNWFHQECIDLTIQEINQILVFFCINCLDKETHLKIIYKDYSKEHTKPLFNSHNILTVHNLYVYHSLLELYKILKFRTPYCVYELFLGSSEVRHSDLILHIPLVLLHCQRQSFIHQASILWNKFYKKLLEPFMIPLHKDYVLKFKLTNSESIHYDYSTKVSRFKSQLSRLLMDMQSNGDKTAWRENNYILTY